MEHTDALIIGGGPAGSVLSLLLAQKGWKVVLVDKNRFPRNKVCGEFLSPAMDGLLKKLGLFENFLAEAPVFIEEATFAFPGKQEIPVNLPPQAYGLSRDSLDTFLLDNARQRGVKVLELHEIKQLHHDAYGFTVHAWNEESQEFRLFHAGTVINASGQNNRFQSRAIFSKQPSLRKIGFKAHFEGIETDRAVKLFFFDGGYLGLVKIENGLTNLCGIVKESFLKKHAFSFDSFLTEASAQNPALWKILKNARRRTDWYSCGPVIHGTGIAYSDKVFHVGDSLSFLEPFFGQGMTFAVASAFLLVGVLGKEVPPYGELDKLGKIYKRTVKKFYKKKRRFGKLLPLFERFQAFAAFKPLLSFLIREACALPELPKEEESLVSRLAQPPASPRTTPAVR